MMNGLWRACKKNTHTICTTLPSNNKVVCLLYLNALITLNYNARRTRSSLFIQIIEYVL